MDFFIIALVAFIISYALTGVVRLLALRFGIIDQPGDQRKIHRKPVPLLGGVAIYGALALAIFLYYFLRPEPWHVITDVHVQGKHLVGILVGALFLVIGGCIDDVFRLKPKTQIVWPVLACLTVIISGVGVEIISNPLGGGALHLDAYKFLVLWYNDLPRYFTLFADVLTFLWLIGSIYTTKLLDGLDGLVSGITVIGMAIIAIVSVFFFINYPTAILATIIAAVFTGFLIWNFYPAKIFLGEGGSTLAGFLLGVCAIISGAKFATLLLILGIPILDAVWVIFRRIFIEKSSPFGGDKKHLHFRLLDVGFSHRMSVLILYFFSASFGALALFFQTKQKFVSLLVLLAIMIVGSALLIKRQQKFLSAEKTK